MTDLTKFNPTEVELHSMVEESRGLTITDPHNTTEVDEVKKHRIKLVKARTKIQSVGKDYRAEALAMQKAVIAKEKELIGITLPEEERLKELEAEAKRTLEREDRMKLLPERQKKLEFAGLEIPDDNYLLDMDNEQFALYYAELLENKMTAEMEKMAKHKEKTELKNELEREEKSLAKNTTYKDFLKKHEYNKVTDILKDTGTHIILYRKVAKLKK